MIIDAKWVMITISAFLAFTFFYLKKQKDLEEALQSCMYSVQKKCGPVIQYASALEVENSSINKKLKKCQSK